MKTVAPVIIASLYITNVVLGTSPGQRNTVSIQPEVQNKEAQNITASCADFNNTTWLEYRQGAKLQVHYLLFTRRNAHCPSLFSQDSLNSTHTLFDPNLPTKVIVHGYRALGTKPSWVSVLARALLGVQDVNVVVVDWVYGASFAYNLVVENYKEVAIQISVLINQLQNHGCKLESFHFIGISLGAHVSGFVGTLFEGKLGRITGLDAAGPMFKGADTFDRLDPSDALFVDAIHTDSDYFGISIPVGHVDFFLNGGMDQAGCARSRFASMYGYVICDHMRALHVYISALNESCPLIGIPCPSYEDFLEGKCLDCKGVLNGTCPQIGLSDNSGITVSPPPKEQRVFLLTTAAPLSVVSKHGLNSRFVTHHILVELEVSPLDKSAEVEVSLGTQGLPLTVQRLRFETGRTVYRRVVAHPMALCEINSIQVKNTGTRFYRQGDLHFVFACLSEIPYLGKEEPVCVRNVAVRRGVPWAHDLVQVCGSA